MNSKLLVLGGICFISVVAAAGFYLRKTELEREQSALRAEIETLAQTAAASARAQEPADDEPFQPLNQNERMELMRLRNEVTQLRATASAARDALKAALQNRPVPEHQIAQHGVQPVIDPATGEPQQTETYDPLTFYRRNPELMKRYFPHLYKAEVESQTVQPAQLDNAAESQPDVPADPLAFYRKNPELMKRYFPHLVKGEEQPEDVSADPAPLPPDSPQQN